MMKNILILLTIATHYDYYEIWQMEVKTTFLINNSLEEELYMEQSKDLFLKLRSINYATSTFHPWP